MAASLGARNPFYLRDAGNVPLRVKTGVLFLDGDERLIG